MTTSIESIHTDPKTAVQETRERDAPRSTAERPETETSKRPTAEDVAAAIEQTGREIVFGARRLEFAYNDTIKRVIVTVRSQDSGEIVRQIPPEIYLKFAAQFRELFGVVIDEQI